MEKRAFKDHVYSEVSRISKLFSNPHRLEIIDLIANGPKSVEDIATETGISIANASQHLQSLKKERFTASTRATINTGIIGPGPWWTISKRRTEKRGGHTPRDMWAVWWLISTGIFSRAAFLCTRPTKKTPKSLRVN